jgi:ADP-heptose:LPS heptosyltransferase
VVAKRRVALRVGRDEKLIGLANGSDHPRGLKKWPVEHWIELAGALIKKGYQLAFFGSMKEKKEVGNELLKRYGSKIWNLAGEFSLAESADALAQCNAFITTDSALMHIADALGVKTICLWGPTLWTKNYPWNGNGTTLSANVDCAPCFGTKKYFACGTQRCMRELTPKSVLEAFDAI